VVILYAALLLLQPYIDRAYGLHLPITPPKTTELATLAAIAVAGCLAGLLPALRAYRLSLADGMTVRI
jgi:putative ABC transport system permease protein